MDTATTGRSTINLTASYNLAPKTVSVNTVYTGETRFIGRNQASRASLYWGESLLSLYWWQLTQNMESAQGFTDTKNKSGTLAKGGIYFTPNITLGVNITDPDFFSIGWRFIDQNLGVYWDGGKNKSISRLIHDQSSPSIWYATDRFAKILYSTVLTDLGQTSAHPNILADPALLKIFSNSTWNVTAMSEHLQELGLAIPGFNLPETPIGVPVVNPSTISTTYLCQVPRQKSAGTLIIAVLVADLVFLQALWKLANLIAGKVLARQDPTGNFCEGCLQKTDPLGTDNPRDGSVVPSKNAGMNRDEYELVGVRTTAMQ
ncbi:hypothetical protein BU16DRAFT_295570 [Lophium mytilinum]|uniref:Uncharacterized protein n=1 Tax=Lophium mytilinum TaxID=390894 RepID=A0A6A6R193_9PEZI|nr:hypothetical protein BU16DRAFT_295570 [Lophium mytilinum]